MKTADIIKLDDKKYHSSIAATEAIQSILEITGIKEHCNTSYMDFITLGKSVLLKSGRSLHAIWISNTYDDTDKKVFQVRLQIEDSFSMTIAPFIRKAIESNSLLLTDETDAQLKAIN